MRKYYLVSMFLLVSLAGIYGQSNLYLEVFGGYAIPLNESYVDTHENKDIFWNPNSGLNAEGRLNFKINDVLILAVPLNVNVGFYAYHTDDGGKVGTEAGTNPDTLNTEWSVVPDLGLMLFTNAGKKSTAPYIGIGAAVGYMHSWETWDFVNQDGNDVLLVISKFYDLAPVFKGEIGWRFKSGKKDFKIAATFNLANYVMKKVVLTNYYIAGEDTIGNWDTRSTVYSYAYDVPDENKGGDCLLGGFAYNNYPQEKISTNLAIKIGFQF